MCFMEPLTDRQKQILAAIINHYVQTASPVSSMAIVEKLDCDICSATIRNEMSQLERLGYITHPHTSAGRVPTDKGYRFFADCLLEREVLDPSDETLIAREYRQKVTSIDELIERTSKILSFLSEEAGLVLYPSQQDMVVKDIHLILYGTRRILVVWATTTGLVENRMMDIEDDISEAEFARLNRFLNARLSGKSCGEIVSAARQNWADSEGVPSGSRSAAREVISHVFDDESSRKFCMDGSRFVLKQPEFRGNVSRSRAFFRALETKDVLVEAFRQDFAPGEIRIQIGTEHAQSDMWDCALVTAQYRARTRPLGALGVLGPKRMPYGRVISLVDSVARRLSDALDRLL